MRFPNCLICVASGLYAWDWFVGWLVGLGFSGKEVLICFFPLLQVIGNKWDLYLDLLQADYTEG